MLPTFIIAGVQKGGTTALFQLLGQHPYVGTSEPKELHFFNVDDNFNRGIGWYEQHFNNCQGKAVVGEATPHYYRSAEAVVRVKDCLPNVKLLFILRNSVDRAYSNYWYNRGKGKENAGFEELLDSPVGMTRYLDKGLYHKYLSRWFETFPVAQLRVLLLEDLQSQPESVMRAVAEFVGVPWHPALMSLRTANPTSIPRNESVARLFRMAWRVRGFVPKPIRSLYQVCVRPLLVKPGYPAMQPAIRRRLVEYYRKDTLALAELIGRDLRHWLRVEPSG